MSDGHLRSPGSTPQSNLPPLSGLEPPATTSTPTVQYTQPSTPAYQAPQGHGTSVDPVDPRRKRNAPRIIALLVLAALLALFAWFLLNRGNDDGDTGSDDTTAQITQNDADADPGSADDNDDADADAMADGEDDAMADGDADGGAMADDDDGDAMADGDTDDDAMAEEPGTVIDTLLGNTDLSIVADGIGQLGLDNALVGEGPFTILAPTNDAFFLVSEDEASRLLGQEDNASSVLSYHVLQGNFSAENFLTALEAQGGSLTIDSLTGEEITVELVGEQVVLNGTSVVVDPDQPATNGVVHTISELLVPPSLTTR